jgi:hypothetical protein
MDRSGQPFPIHPLDLSDVKTIDDVTVCVSSFFPGAGNTDFDMLFGDSIMRNMYSVFVPSLPFPSWCCFTSTRN